MLLGWLILTACGRIPPPEEAARAHRLLVSDLRGNGWLIGDLDGEVEAAGSLAALDPDHCPEGDTARTCLLYQSRHRIAADGSAEVSLTYSPLDHGNGYDIDRDDLIGVITAVGSADGETRWAVDSLDWTGVAHTSACLPHADDVCAASDEATDDQAHACGLFQPHDLLVFDEDDAAVGLWVADTRNGRVLRLTVDKGDRCARVEEELSVLTVPDWDIYLSVNSLALLDDGMLLTVKDSYARSEAGAAQLGGAGKGKLLRLDADGWTQMWEFPPQSTTTESFVNAPHGVAVDPERGWALFGHALGRSDQDWNTGSGGSVAAVSLADGRYLADLVLPDELGIAYARDVVVLPDGTWLVVDSGCRGGLDCDHGTGIWHVRAPDALDPAPGTGAWTPTGANQTFVALERISGPHFTDATSIYSAEVLPSP